jgi:hypothetical protein
MEMVIANSAMAVTGLARMFASFEESGIGCYFRFGHGKFQFISAGCHAAVAELLMCKSWLQRNSLFIVPSRFWKYHAFNSPGLIRMGGALYQAGSVFVRGGNNAHNGTKSGHGSSATSVTLYSIQCRLATMARTIR